MSIDDYNDKLAAILNDALDNVEGFLSPFLENCESPIEKLFLHAVWANGVWNGFVEFVVPCGFEFFLDGIGVDKAHFAQQIEISGYRVDFLFAISRANGEPPFVVAVECDGHDFHEKTKEQAARDKKRDRTLNDAGVIVYRFSGSEIWADAGDCAKQIIVKLWDENRKSWERNRARSLDMEERMNA